MEQIHMFEILTLTINIIKIKQNVPGSDMAIKIVF